MLSALFSSLLVQINIVVILILVIILTISVIGVKYNNFALIKYAKAGIDFILSLFGIFRCQNRRGYCYLGFNLKNNRLAIGLLVELGIIILGIHIGIAWLVVHLGATACMTQATPIIGYFAYPAILYCFRKKCG